MLSEEFEVKGNGILQEALHQVANAFASPPVDSLCTVHGSKRRFRHAGKTGVGQEGSCAAHAAGPWSASSSHLAMGCRTWLGRGCIRWKHGRVPL